jgi:pimeloyl-ACP methyl ester carboxylesterase
MKRNLLPLAAWLAASAGCSSEYCARSLVAHGSITGTVRQAMLGAPEKLIRQGKIDIHRRIEAHDGAMLDVWAIRSRKEASRGTVVLLHGLWDTKARLYGVGQHLADRGFDVILPDNRCHGRSTGEYITWGAREKHDVETIVDVLTSREALDSTIYAFGVSMGGCIAVQYAAHDDRCAAVMAVAPAAGARQVLRRMFPLMGSAKLDATRRAVEELAGFDIDQASAIQAAGRLNCPLLVVHGKLDLTVPYWHGRSIFEAAGQPKRMHPIWWAGHTSILVGRDKWFAARIEDLAEQAAGDYAKGGEIEPSAGPPPVGD